MTIVHLHDGIYMVVIGKKYCAVRRGLRNAMALAWQRAGL